MRQYAHKFTRFILLILFCTRVNAFELLGQKWGTTTTTFYVNISEPWNSAFSEAADSWNNATIFTIGINNSFLDPCLNDDKNGVGFNSTVCGDSYGTNTLAVTMSIFNAANNQFIETDIVYNQNVSWDIYNGPPQSSADFRRVTVHELGHALGLGHQTNSAIDSIMKPFVGAIEVPQNDDITAVEALYINQCNPETFNSIRPNEVVQGSLSVNDCKINDLDVLSGDYSFVDAYQVTLFLAGQLDIDLVSTDFDSYVLLLDSDRNILFEDDDSGGGANAFVSQSLSVGHYFIYANSYNAGEEGVYQLTTSCDGCENKQSDDFGGDGKADILLRNSISGQLFLYEMDGNSITASNIGGLSLVWNVESLGDFGGDGKADILLRNSGTGQLFLYEMNGNSITPSNIGGLPLAWNVEGTGDFGGDGKTDILLRNSGTGQLFLYEMDGNSITASNIGGLPLAWDVVDINDFGGDGKADILLRNSGTGQLFLYEMNGNSITPSNIGGLSLTWNVVGTGDFGGDGKADILLRNADTGQLYLYEMNGNSITPSNIGGLNTSWDVKRIADYGGDGKADILLRHSGTGQLFLYEMDGNSITPSNIGGLSGSWVVQGQ